MESVLSSLIHWAYCILSLTITRTPWDVVCSFILDICLLRELQLLSDCIFWIVRQILGSFNQSCISVKQDRCMFQYHCKRLFLSNWRNVLTEDVIFCTLLLGIFCRVLGHQSLGVHRFAIFNNHQNWRIHSSFRCYELISMWKICFFSLRVAEAQPPQTKVTTATLRQRGAL